MVGLQRMMIKILKILKFFPTKGFLIVRYIDKSDNISEIRLVKIKLMKRNKQMEISRKPNGETS
tara:strand:+ start:299 stop:490 length:192 start_codon:yes stop_codon:yes gene_type:complete